MKLEDQTPIDADLPGEGRPRLGGGLTVEELDVVRERRPLESYFQEIGGTRTLKREEEVVLAKELEASTAALRNSLYSIPFSARYVVDRWDGLRALSHTGAKLSESAGDEETSEIAARVERAIGRLRKEVKKREALWAFAECFSKSLAEDATGDTKSRGSVDRLRQAVSAGDIATIRREAVVTFDDARTSVQKLVQATANAGYPSTVRK